MDRRRFLVLSALMAAQTDGRSIGQSPSHSPFQVQYAASGIASLQKVQDQYATDYLESGHTLGDMSIRYRAVGTESWSEISAASRDTRAQSSAATYTLNCLQATHADGALNLEVPISGGRVSVELMRVGK